MSKLDVTFNDRYSAVHPELDRLQNVCDIHFTREGYSVLADQDWKVFSELLRRKEMGNLPSPGGAGEGTPGLTSTMLEWGVR